MKKIIIITITTLIGFSVQGQDVHFSQLKSTSVYNSVASAGAISNAQLRSSLHYRNQWFTIGDAYQTYSLATDYKLEMDDWQGNHIGIGLILFKDEQGALNFNRLQAKLSLAYHQKISKYSFISGGVQIGITQHSIDGSKAEWATQFNGKEHDKALPSQEGNLFQPFINYDVGAGLLWRYDTKSKNRFTTNAFNTFNIGLSVYHLTGSSLSYNAGEKDKMKYVAFANTAFFLKENEIELEPSVLFQMKGKELEFVFGALNKIIFIEPSYYTGYYSQFDLSFGVYYRLPNDAIIPTVSMNYDNYSVGLSYDINLSELNQASAYQGGIEIFLKYMLR